MSALEQEWPDEDRRHEALVNALCDVHLAEPERAVSPAEARVLEALSRGLGREGAADVLCLSPFTVDQHVKNARRALGAKDKTHACCEALRLGIIR